MAMNLCRGECICNAMTWRPTDFLWDVPGASRLHLHLARRAHTEACRRRMETELKGTDRAKDAAKRRDEFIEKAISKDVEKREVKKGKSEQGESAGEEVSQPGSNDVTLNGDDQKDEPEEMMVQTNAAGGCMAMMHFASATEGR